MLPQCDRCPLTLQIDTERRGQSEELGYLEPSWAPGTGDGRLRGIVRLGPAGGFKIIFVIIRPPASTFYDAGKPPLGS